MRRNNVLPAVAVFMVVFAVAAAGFMASRIKSPGSTGGASLRMAEQLLRRDATTGIEIAPGVVVAALDQMVNAGVTNAADRMNLPIAANARLIGSTHIQGGDGGSLVLVMYEVDQDMSTLAEALSKQLDQSPWQVTGAQGQATQRVLGFRNTRNDLEGSVTVRLQPQVDAYSLTVSRGGKDVTVRMKITALAPSVGAATQPDLTIVRVEPGPAQVAGLQAGDKILRVNDTTVKNPQELAAALAVTVVAGSPRSSVAYLLAQAPSPDQAARASAFVAPQPPLVLPANFPAAQAWQGLTVVDYATGQVERGRAYNLRLVSKDPAAAVANRVRDGLKAAGWTIVSDTPQGFATQLEVANQAQGLVGQVAIDHLEGDSAYIQVVVRIQSGTPAGRP